MSAQASALENLSDGEPIGEKDLVFLPAASIMRNMLGELRRSHLSIINRLKSISHDASYVQDVAKIINLPLVANERCGSWYISPGNKVGSAYFKSTDGHFGQWSFSLRRLNLQIFDIIQAHQGCIIVDSTRKGKSMPDALSKTVPIWACVMNRLLYPELIKFHKLQVPEDVVSNSERIQIEEKIDGLVVDARALNLDLIGLRKQASARPLRIAWQRPSDPIYERDAELQEVNLLLLCTASSASSASSSAATLPFYVQGAADDSESWAHGLTTAEFWQNKDALLASPEDNIVNLITAIRSKTENGFMARMPRLVKQVGNLWVANNDAIAECGAQFDLIVSCASDHDAISKPPEQVQSVVLLCGPGKVGSRRLRAELSKILTMRHFFDHHSRTLVTCQTGQDLSVGVAVVALCLFYDNDCSARSPEEEAVLTKVVIKHRLSWIMSSIPDASPSRATLQSVNAFLLS